MAPERSEALAGRRCAEGWRPAHGAGVGKVEWGMGAQLAGVAVLDGAGPVSQEVPVERRGGLAGLGDEDGERVAVLVEGKVLADELVY